MNELLKAAEGARAAICHNLPMSNIAAGLELKGADKELYDALLGLEHAIAACEYVWRKEVGDETRHT